MINCPQLTSALLRDEFSPDPGENSADVASGNGLKSGFLPRRFGVQDEAHNNNEMEET